MQVARYHSLAVEEDTLPKELKVTARSKDGEVMAMEHEKYQSMVYSFTRSQL